MLLPKPKPHIPSTTLLGRLADRPSSDVGPTEVNADVGGGGGLQAGHVATVDDAVAHGAQELPEIGPAEVGAALEFGEGIEGGADAVEVDVGPGVLVHALGEVGVDAEELGVGGVAGVGGRLGLEGRQQGLEPLEAGGVAADPDELDAPEALGRVRAGALVPDVLEDAGPGRDADAGADEHRDLVVEHVFGRGAVGPVDADRRHGLALLQRDFVHAVRVQGVVFLGLGGAGAESVGGGAGPVADLAHVDADVGVEGAGGDGIGVPLVPRHRGDVDEEPLAGFVAHAGFGELDLHRVVGVADHLEDGGGAPRADLAVDALEEVESAGPEFPAPALVADAVRPEVVAGEGGEGEFGVAHEAAGGVGVEGEKEGNEEVVRVPERFEGLLPDLGVRGGVHEEHAEEHDVAGDAAGLGVVDFDGGDGADLGLFDVEEAGIAISMQYSFFFTFQKKGGSMWIELT